MMACVSSRMFTTAPPVCTASPEAPSKHPYKLIKELGSGLQGRVVLALDTASNKHVAVKLPTSFPAYEDEPFDSRLLEYQVKSIMREREAHRFVHHGNVIQCIRTMPGSKRGRSYVALVTEYASNGDLFDTIADNGALPGPLAKFYFRQLMCGIQACHTSGVAHRDIKPENILFDDNFTLKICDFGLAVASTKREHADKMVLGDFSGTALYMAPEVSAEQSYRATPVDVWACGVVLFIMLTGYPPFQDAKAGDYWFDLVMTRRMARFWADQPSRVTKLLSPDVKDLLNRMLCPNPDMRITVPEIFAHPWLHDDCALTSAEAFQIMNQRMYPTTPQSCVI